MPGVLGDAAIVLALYRTGERAAAQTRIFIRIHATQTRRYVFKHRYTDTHTDRYTHMHIHTNTRNADTDVCRKTQTHRDTDRQSD